MRRRTWITCIVVLGVCLLLLLLKKGPPSDLILPDPANNHSNGASKSVESADAPSAATPLTSRVATAPATATPVETPLSYSNRLWAQRLAMWQVPIEFYGKCVDENGNGLSGVNIQFQWMETPHDEDTRTATTQTDSEGLFSLHGKRGANLGVSFGKEGYYASQRGLKGFKYAFGPNVHSPDPRNPVIFTLRKKGVPERLVAMKRNYKVPRDGTPVSVDLSSGKTTTGEGGDLILRCWTNDEGKKSGERYDWRCLVALPGGGMSPTEEEFPFLAPDEGYAPSTEITMPVDRTNWTSQVDLKFYFRLADGRFGRMKFSIIAGGHHFCMIDSVLNPTGSRNLEPAN